MQLQMAVSALLFTSLFAIPAEAIEDDECKKKRAAKIESGRESVSSRQKAVDKSPSQQMQNDSSKSSQDVEFEGVPADYYKKLDLNSF
jgi:Skp family chaperone for outer membrane proteins